MPLVYSFSQGEKPVLELVGAEMFAGGAAVSGQTLSIVVQGTQGELWGSLGMAECIPSRKN